MRWHVVGTFGRVRVERVVFGDQAVQPGLQVAPRRRVGVLLNRQRGRCMAYENRA